MKVIQEIRVAFIGGKFHQHAAQQEGNSRLKIIMKEK